MPKPVFCRSVGDSRGFVFSFGSVFSLMSWDPYSSFIKRFCRKTTLSYYHKGIGEAIFASPYTKKRQANRLAFLKSKTNVLLFPATQEQSAKTQETNCHWLWNCCNCNTETRQRIRGREQSALEIEASLYCTTR